MEDGLPHPAFADQRGDFVAAESTANRQSHVLGLYDWADVAIRGASDLRHSRGALTTPFLHECFEGLAEQSAHVGEPKPGTKPASRAVSREFEDHRLQPAGLRRA